MDGKKTDIVLLVRSFIGVAPRFAAFGQRPLSKGARCPCMSQDVFASGAIPLPLASGSFSLAATFVTSAGFGVIAASALAVRSLKDIFFIP